MRIHFFGVRGSTASPGAEFVGYGGHTSCVGISVGDAPISLVLDAGTGLRQLTGRLAGEPFRGAILLSHLHWDHMQGIPFFSAGDRSGSQVAVYLPAQEGATGLELLSQSMAPPSFPITPEGLLGHWTFTALESGLHDIEGFSVTAAEVPHKGGRTFGYLVADGVQRVAYLPDHVAVGSDHGRLAGLVADADVLIHDAQFLEPERKLAQAYGHSTVDDAIDLASDFGVKHLVLFHHSPTRTDEQLDDIAKRYPGRDALSVTVAREGEVLEV